MGFRNPGVSIFHPLRSSLEGASAEGNRRSSFGPADRRPSACSNLPPLPRQLLRSRIRLSASSWISGRMALSFPIWQSYLRFWKTVIFVFQVIFVFYIETGLCFLRNPTYASYGTP